MKILLMITALSFPLVPCLRADAALDAANAIAKAGGLEVFSEVQSIAFTFNVQLPEKVLTRSWVWEPKHGQVTAVHENKTYDHKSPAEADKKTDAQFINDQYWLLFPFHLVWDTDTKLTLAEEKIPAPISGTPFQRLTIQYGSGGYTPGDAYDLFFDDDYIVREWIFRKGGSETPTRVTTWEDYKTFSGLNIAQDHRGPDNFRLWFTDVKVEP